MFQWLVVVDCTPCDIDERWYYQSLKSDSVHDVLTGVGETFKQDTSGNLITGHTLPWCDVFLIVPAEHCVTFHKAAGLNRFVRDACVGNVPPLIHDMEDRLLWMSMQRMTETSGTFHFCCVWRVVQFAWQFLGVQREVSLVRLRDARYAGASFGLHLGV